MVESNEMTLIKETAMVTSKIGNRNQGFINSSPTLIFLLSFFDKSKKIPPYLLLCRVISNREIIGRLNNFGLLFQYAYTIKFILKITFKYRIFELKISIQR